MCKRQRGETAKIKENFSLKFNLWDLAAVVLTVALSVGIYAIYRPYSHAEKTGLVAYVYADGSLIDGGKSRCPPSKIPVRSLYQRINFLI